MNNVNDITDMLKDRLVECSRKTSRINKDIDDPDSTLYSFAELIEAQELEAQLRSILLAITGEYLYWIEDNQEFINLAR